MHFGGKTLISSVSDVISSIMGGDEESQLPVYQDAPAPGGTYSGPGPRQATGRVIGDFVAAGGPNRIVLLGLLLLVPVLFIIVKPKGRR